GPPLMGPGRAFGQLPFIAEEVGEKDMAPLGGQIGPCPFKPTGDGVAALSTSIVVLPAQPLHFQGGGYRLGLYMALGRSRPMGLSKGMSPCNKGHRLIIVHGHTPKSIPDIV